VFATSVNAAPTGGVVTTGNANISQNGAVTNINQSTQKATINWQGFSIAPSETVQFNQPNSQSMTLNRVIGNEKSVIDGALNANGKVFLINANGVLINKDAQINTAGLVASTLNITDENFNSGNFVFQGNGGNVINMGTVKITDGGYVALLGEQVKNEGVIIANLGSVSLNGANKVTLNFNGDSLVSVVLDEGALNALVENKHAISTPDGGKIILTAKAADELVASSVNLSGIITAKTLDELTGKTNIVTNTQTINVETSADNININNSLAIETNGNIALNANKDININAPVTIDGEKAHLSMDFGHAYNILTKASFSGVEVVAPTEGVLGAGASTAQIDTSGGVYGKVTLNGSDASLTINGENYVLVHDLTELKLKSGITGKYALVQDIDAKDTTFTAAVMPSLTVNSILAGLGHKVENLNINISGVGNIGLIGVNQGEIRDIGIVNANISSGGYSGALAGRNIGKISHAYSENGTVNGVDNIGGLVGGSLTAVAKIEYCFATGTVAGNNYVGGLVGASTQGAVTTHSHAAKTGTGIGEVTATTGNVGGLIGSAAGVVESSWSNLDIAGEGAGGLLGYVSASNNTSVSDSFATGNIRGGKSALGGLIGYTGSASASNPIKITNSYATGSVKGYTQSYNDGEIGGLIGNVTNNAIITHVHATGNVIIYNNGAQSVGGLIGVLGQGSVLAWAYAPKEQLVIDESKNKNSQYFGGLVGSNVGKIQNSEAFNSPQGGYFVGGLVGGNAGSISNSIAHGKPTATNEDYSDRVGGIAGQINSDASMTDVAWDVEVSGQDKAYGFVLVKYPPNGGPAIEGPYIDGAFGLTTAELANDGIRSAILNGGDVPSAIKAFHDHLAAAEQAEREAKEEQARQEEEERRRKEEQERETQRVITEAISNFEAKRLAAEQNTQPPATPQEQISLNKAIIDYSASPAAGPASASFGADVRIVVVDGVPYLVSDDDEERPAKETAQ
jgi:filamentous hemagglutinin family protein